MPAVPYAGPRRKSPEIVRATATEIPYVAEFTLR
jgi:hypothetical protein